jgi:hypothetical protein
MRAPGISGLPQRRDIWITGSRQLGYADHASIFGEQPH